MDIQKYFTLIVTTLLTVAIIGTALYLRGGLNPQTRIINNSAAAATRAFDKQALAEFDGKDGHECYVAVDGKVYRIEQGRLWENGKHGTSQGNASCGRDLTKAMEKSPHGKSKLTTLEIVGTFTDD